MTSNFLRGILYYINLMSRKFIFLVKQATRFVVKSTNNFFKVKGTPAPNT